MGKRLYKSTNKVLAGVCGGIAEYLNCDPTIVRLIYVLVSVFSAGFPGLLVYLIAMLIIPDKNQMIEQK